MDKIKEEKGEIYFWRGGWKTAHILDKFIKDGATDPEGNLCDLYVSKCGFRDIAYTLHFCDIIYTGTFDQAKDLNKVFCVECSNI